MKSHLMGDLLIIGIPTFFMITTVASIYLSTRNSEAVAADCIKGAIRSGFLNGFVQFIALCTLLTKGTDGPGGLIAIILPVVTFFASLAIGIVVGMIAQVVSATKSSKSEISPQAQAILRKAPPRPPLQLVRNESVQTEESWRSHARRGKSGS